jgi:hypothetical protein
MKLGVKNIQCEYGKISFFFFKCFWVLNGGFGS